MKTTFEVRVHPRSKEHLLLVVTTGRGYVYACSSAWTPEDGTPKPNAQTIQYLWKHDRYQFLPYNETEGCYA